MPYITVESVRASEEDYLSFIINLSEPATSAVTVDYQTYGGTAVNGLDNYDNEGQVTFAIGETSKTVRVYAGYDRLTEPDEAFEFELFNPIGARFTDQGHSLRAIGWILDNEPGGGARALAISSPVVREGKGYAEFVVSLSEAYAEETTFRYATQSGEARSGSDFVGKKGTVTFDAGETEAVVRVRLDDDGKSEASESFALKVSGNGLKAVGRADILDNDATVLSVEGGRAEEGDYVNFTVRLSKASTSDVTVGYQTFGGTAVGNVDYYETSSSSYYNQLTFLAGETTKVVRVYATSDSLSEPDEVFHLQLQNPVGARFEKADRTPMASAFILDDDPGVRKSILAVSDVKVREDAGYANFVISASRPVEEDVAIRFKTEKGSASSGKDFIADSGRVIMAAGSDEAIVSIRIRDDSRRESPETFKLKITGYDRADFAPRGHDLQGTASISDDDAGRAAHWDGDTLI